MTRRIPLHAGRAFKGGYALSPDGGAPRVITYAEIHDDGSECVRSGRVWSEGERVRGMSTFWIRAEHDTQMYLVARAHRRVGVGRVRGAKYRPGRGRVVEVGEWFTETHAHSPLGAYTHRARWSIRVPRVIRVEPLPAHVMAILGGASEHPA